MKGKLRGSYTIEAAFVMAIIIWALMVSIQAAYRLRDKAVGSMALGEAVQRLRHNETEPPDEAAQWVEKRAGTPFSFKKYDFQINLTGNPVTGNQVQAWIRAGTWKLEIQQGVFDPENFLRMWTLINQEEGNENSLQTGNEAQLFDHGAGEG